VSAEESRARGENTLADADRDARTAGPSGRDDDGSVPPIASIEDAAAALFRLSDLDGDGTVDPDELMWLAGELADLARRSRWLKSVTDRTLRAVRAVQHRLAARLKAGLDHEAARAAAAARAGAGAAGAGAADADAVGDGDCDDRRAPPRGLDRETFCEYLGAIFAPIPEEDVVAFVSKVAEGRGAAHVGGGVGGALTRGAVADGDDEVDRASRLLRESLIDTFSALEGFHFGMGTGAELDEGVWLPRGWTPLNPLRALAEELRGRAVAEVGGGWEPKAGEGARGWRTALARYDEAEAERARELLEGGG